jgi:SAM-dependent methyltransferase
MSFLRVGFIKAFASSGKLLDVGFGTGAFIKAAEKAGYDAFGCDAHGEECGVRRAPLDGDEVWDVVTFFDSLEHFPDLAPIRRLIGRAKLVVVTLPSTPADLLTNQRWRHYKPGEHLHYFCRKSLSALFAPMRILAESDAEDAIRGRASDGTRNILTVAMGH